MDDKQLKKLKREELLEIMLAQSEEIDRLTARVAELEAEVSDRRIKFRKVGSLAEASLAATKYFEEAEKAAALYLENIKRVADRFAAEERQAGRPAPEKPAEEKNENPAEDDSVGPWNTEDAARAAEAKPAAEQKVEEPNEETAEAAEEAAEESQAEEFKEL